MLDLHYFRPHSRDNKEQLVSRP